MIDRQGVERDLLRVKHEVLRKASKEAMDDAAKLFSAGRYDGAFESRAWAVELADRATEAFQEWAKMVEEVNNSAAA